MKYKVGDKVKIKTWDQMEKEFKLDYQGCITTNENNGVETLSFTPEMEQKINNLNENRVLTINHIHENSTFGSCDMAGYFFCFTDEMIDCLITEKAYEPIHSRFEILDIR